MLLTPPHLRRPPRRPPQLPGPDARIVGLPGRESDTSRRPGATGLCPCLGGRRRPSGGAGPHVIPRAGRVGAAGIPGWVGALVLQTIGTATATGSSSGGDGAGGGRSIADAEGDALGRADPDVVVVCLGSAGDVVGLRAVEVEVEEVFGEEIRVRRGVYWSR